MPTYVYECDSCGERFEYTQPMSEAAKTVCEKCAGHLTKIIVPTAFVLKGGGWYKDLYSTPKSSGGESKSSSESKSDSGGKTESKSESKSETKTETKSDAKPEKKD